MKAIWKSLRRLVVASVALPLCVTAAWGAAGPWAENDHGRLRLVSAADGQVEGQRAHVLGLQFQLQPGWKIYWRSPGDAGFPPRIDWSGSSNLEQADLSWPVPHRFSLFGLETFGYGDEVVLPIEVRPNRAQAAVDLVAKVDYLTCNEICVPYSETVSLNLPAGPGGPSPESYLIEHFSEQVPGDGTAVGLELLEASLEGDNQTPEIVARVRAREALLEPDLIVEGPPFISYSKPMVELSDDGLEAVFRVPAIMAAYDGVLEGKMLTLTVVDGPRGMEQPVVARFSDTAAAAAGAPGQAAGPSVSIWQVLAYALLGGLILNLMPCVLPVLSLKLLSVVKQGGRGKKQVRMSFLASAAGIIFSFLVLAAGAVAVKAAGMSVGWGIQFQQPLFLAFMALLLTFFACNLFGFFEILLPSRLGDAAAAGGGQGLGGSFATGAFATLLATPCSAPFLGVAVGFALARQASEIFSVFFVLGIGLALPYLLVALFPGLATRLPKPGPWMLHLRRILGLALAATAVWLLTVLANQIGGEMAAFSGVLLALLGVALWLRNRGTGANRARLASPVVAGLLALSVLVLPAVAPNGVASEQSADEAWAPLDLATIAAEVEAGNVVLVDVTADWCLTCQVNKKLVLENDQVAGTLQAEGVVLQRGDWTSPSEEISDYLASFGRYGIPFNAVYGPGAPEGLALQELLSVDEVLQAIEQAKGG